ncbi:MAG: hypothetical protein JXC32_12225 [Anaerolineae bacterium]|nr:hypothetical protein [Anaerolineae bacterium]
MNQSPTDVTLLIARILEVLKIPYAIGGSLASATHGAARATTDVDIVAALDQDHVTPLLRRVQDEFYADEGMIREAVHRHASFNILHLATMFKVDVFIAGARSFDAAQLQRRQRVRIGETPGELAYVITPEDTILAKLDWYRKGQEVSDRQWRDVLGVIRVQEGRLDWAYLEGMAETLGVADLLHRARSQAVIDAGR